MTPTMSGNASGDNAIADTMATVPLSHRVEWLRTCWLVTGPGGSLSVGGALGPVTAEQVAYVVERTS